MSQPATGRRAAVLGSPISHSKSPQLHGAAYAQLGLPIDYTRIEVDEQQLAVFMAGEGNAPGWCGFSVTMPLKAAMVGHMDSTSSRVETLGVLNTVIVTTDDDGARHLHGENTDVDGIVQALDLEQRPTQTEGPFVIIGAGGTSAAALGAAAEAGAGTAVIYARSPERAAALEPVAEALGLVLLVRELTDLSQDLSRGPAPSAMVSTLPPGAADNLAEALPGSLPGTDHPIPLLDVAYDPWPSRLATQWEKAGGEVVSGLEMLLHQAVRQVELFTGATRTEQMVAAMRAAI